MSTTPKTLTVTECHQLLDALLVKNGSRNQFRKGVRNYLIALLMLDAGLRVGEVVDLQMSNLYFAEKPVESITVRTKKSKTNETRTVPVSGRLKSALEEYFIDGDWIAKCGDGRFAFPISYLGDPITTRQVERIIRAAAMKSLGRPVHPHVLRHTFASRLMRKTNARIVQELLGHKNLSSTQIYMSPNHDDLKNAINQIESCAAEDPDMPGHLDPDRRVT